MQNNSHGKELNKASTVEEFNSLEMFTWMCFLKEDLIFNVSSLTDSDFNGLYFCCEKRVCSESELPKYRNWMTLIKTMIKV